MRAFLTLLIAALLLVAPVAVSGQCAMCKANVEAAANDSRNTNNVAGGLNNGILYLLAVPYLAATIIGIAWYRQRKRLQRETS